MCCACVLTVHFLKEILGSIRYLHALKLGLGVCSGLVPIYCNCYDKYLYTHAEQASNIKCSQIHFKIKHLFVGQYGKYAWATWTCCKVCIGEFSSHTANSQSWIPTEKLLYSSQHTCGPSKSMRSNHSLALSLHPSPDSSTSPCWFLSKLLLVWWFDSEFWTAALNCPVFNNCGLSYPQCCFASCPVCNHQ